MNDFLEITTEKTNFIIVGKSYNSKSSLALHKVINGKVTGEIPFTKNTAKSIFSVFDNYNFEPLQFKGLIPKDILLAKSTPQSTKLVFTLSNAKRKIYYSDSSFLNTDSYSLPNLVFIYDNKKITVYAYTDKHLNDTSELFQAPFFNVYASGEVCMGNVDFKLASKLKTFDALKEYIITAFFNSVFTHSNTSKIDSNYIKQTQNIKVWKPKDLIKPFANKKDKKLTLNDIL